MMLRALFVLFASAALAVAGELHQAARACDVDRLKQVLAQHPALNEPDENGLLPLHVAIDGRKRACVWLLLEAGADRQARDRQGRTSFDAAETIADPQDRMLMAYMLKSFGSDAPNRQQPSGPKPGSLEYAVAHRQPEVIKVLLAMGVDPNAAGTGGATPLADAALKGDLGDLRVLLARGARVDTVSKTGMQPIHDAALGGHAEVIRELVKQGADLNARTQDTEAQTPLHIAAVMDRTRAIETLASLGADLTIRDSHGRTALDAAEHAGLPDVVALLKRAPAAK